MDTKVGKIKKRALVSSLGILAILCAVGSVTGTVAWYQYSTRSVASITGTDASCVKNLQMYIGTDKDTVVESDWKTELSFNEISQYIKDHDETIKNPGDIQFVSNYLTNDDQSISGVYKDSKLGTFYSMPKYQDDSGLDGMVIAPSSSYIQFPLTFRMKDVKTNANSTASHNLYLENLVIESLKEQKDEDDDKDYSVLADAIRVHYSSVVDDEEKNYLISKKGETLDNYGPLDLNGDGKNDKPLGTYDFSSETDDLVYGVKGTTESSFASSSMLPEKQNGHYVSNTGHSLTTIPENGTATITVTIYLDGWQTYEDKPILDTYLLGTRFNVGMTFGVDYVA